MFGSILIQEQLGLTDRETVDTIRENPYGFEALDRDLYRKLLFISEVYRQQQEMYDDRKRTIPTA